MARPISYDTYQILAGQYSELAPDKDYNAHYDRPATLSLIDDLNGRKILDAGCGPGIYSEILVNKGADVTGIDVSENMLHYARLRNGDKVKFITANMEEPLDMFANDEFDGIVSALAITYVKDLSLLFSEFNRVLKSGGWLVFSTEHPFFAYKYFKIDNYFEIQAVSCQWNSFNFPVQMNSYFHSLGCLTGSLTNNGFVIEEIVEPLPTDEFKKQDPQGYERRMKFPSFIHFKTRKK